MQSIARFALAALVVLTACAPEPEPPPPEPRAAVVERFAAAPGSIAVGDQATLAWKVAHATRCALDENEVEAEGSTAVAPALSTSYRLACVGEDGAEVEASVRVNVFPAPRIDSFAANPSPLAAGTNTTLSWATRDATGCRIDPSLGAVPASGSRSVTLFESATFTLTCHGQAGSPATATTQAVVLPGARIVSFDAAPRAVKDGEATTLSWQTSGAASCSLDQGIGGVETTGTASVTPNGETTYQLVCEGAVGAPASARVIVRPAVQVRKLTATPGHIARGGTATLEWKADHATGCTLQPGAVALAHSGTHAVTPTTNTEYVLSCSGAENSKDERRVTVSVGAPLSISKLTATPGTIDAGDFVLLEWKASAQSCSIDPGLGTVAIEDSTFLRPAESTTYTLTCSAGGVPDVVRTAHVRVKQQITGVRGGEHACVSYANGRVRCWGRNDRGQLGLGDKNNRGDAPGQLASLPYVALGEGLQAVEVQTGGGHACAVFDDGRLKCWGRNDRGQLGLGNAFDRGDDAGEMGDNLPFVNLGAGELVQTVALGADHSCALLASGAVKCWGRNDNGQLGLGDRTQRGANANTMGNALPAVSLGTGRTAQALAAGHQHTCALLDDGSVKCWGSGIAGQLGHGQGTANRGELAGQMGDALVAVDLGIDRYALAITAGQSHTCALLDNSAVKCWGQNLSGQLGVSTPGQLVVGDDAAELGDALQAVSLGLQAPVAIAAGSMHTCALLADHSVKCWGDNGRGQLGLGHDEPRGADPAGMGASLPAVSLGAGRRVTAIVAGAHNTCALLDDRDVKCWGDNGRGQLGLGDTSHRGDQPNEMGDALPVLDL